MPSPPGWSRSATTVSTPSMMSNGREHLRALLVAHGVLPGRDRYLAAFERWAEDRVRRVEDPKDRQLIAAYLRWHHGPRLSRLAESGDLTESRYAGARAQTNIAVGLLAWLRQRDSDLATCTQGDIDTWFATGPTTRLQSRSFLSWAVRTHRRAALELPPDRPAAPRGIPEHARLDLLARFLADDDIDLVDRVAGCLVLLYALPLTRINRLRATDFESVEGGQALRIGDDLVPVPSAARHTRPSAHRATEPRQQRRTSRQRLALPRTSSRTAHRTRSARGTPQPTRCHQSGAHRRARRLARHRARASSGQAHRPPALARGSTNETPGDGLEELRRSTSTVLTRSGRNTRQDEYASPPV